MDALCPFQTLLPQICCVGLLRKDTGPEAAFSSWKDVPSHVSGLASEAGPPAHPGGLSHHPGSRKAVLGQSRPPGPPAAPFQGRQWPGAPTREREVCIRGRRCPLPKGTAAPDHEEKGTRRGSARSQAPATQQTPRPKAAPPGPRGAGPRTPSRSPGPRLYQGRHPSHQGQECR
jgi:hypothetical protein